jgi:anthranilate synthase/aminodeoxychorismate synthase-like glutamine amidotransferase
MSKKETILVIDNYDSFTFNLVQMLGINKLNVIVYKNDEISIRRINTIKPDRILISPGPGKPENSKASLSAIENFYDKIPILGVCLGHQAIAIVFGGKVIKASEPKHGKTSVIIHDQKKIYAGIKSPLIATRYHSLIVDESSLTRELTITARTEDKFIMGLRHITYPLEGIQFHPESILTRTGKKLISNWLKPEIS